MSKPTLAVYATVMFWSTLLLAERNPALVPTLGFLVVVFAMAATPKVVPYPRKTILAWALAHVVLAGAYVVHVSGWQQALVQGISATVGVAVTWLLILGITLGCGRDA